MEDLAGLRDDAGNADGVIPWPAHFTLAAVARGGCVTAVTVPTSLLAPAFGFARGRAWSVAAVSRPVQACGTPPAACRQAGVGASGNHPFNGAFAPSAGFPTNVHVKGLIRLRRHADFPFVPLSLPSARVKKTERPELRTGHLGEAARGG